jgi:hypothetical protein
MGGYARNAQDAQESAIQAQLVTLRTVVGPEPRYIQFDKFLCSHDVHGWRARHETRYRALHDGAVPTGSHALATRVAFVSDWYKTIATPAERSVIDADFADYKVNNGVTSLLRLLTFVTGGPKLGAHSHPTRRRRARPCAWGRDDGGGAVRVHLHYSSSLVTGVDRNNRCSLGVQPVVSRIADGLSRSTGLTFLTLVAGHMQASGHETMRTFGYAGP